jgi:hypothetical protein
MIQPGRKQDEWRVDPPKGHNGVSIVASVHGPDMEANANLIAAAPDLLKALKAAEKEIRRLHMLHGGYYEGRVGEPKLSVADKARAAITKAEGRK